MKKNNQQYIWRKLDNTAKIFSLDDKHDTNIFRYSVLLTDIINPSKLEKALKKALKDYPEFKVAIGSGLFWNYLDYNEKEPLISEENEIPCEYIKFSKNNNYLFKVTYYKNKINLDMFHALTDGNGAIIFLKSIIAHYLNLKYKLGVSKPRKQIKISYEDQTLKYYDKRYQMAYDFKPAYQLKGRVNKKINHTYHYIVSVSEIKELCKRLKVTITEYLTATYLYAMYLSLYDKKTNKEINVTVPINLRKFYHDETVANFFTYMNIVSNFTNKDRITFDDILKHVKKEFKEKLTDEKIKEYLARDVNLGMNLPIRLVPLIIKKLFIKFMGELVMRSSTTALSNIGIIDIEKRYKKYIENILILVRPGRVQKIKCTICSFANNLNITINANINDEMFQNTFLYLLKKHLKEIKIINNKLVRV